MDMVDIAAIILAVIIILIAYKFFPGSYINNFINYIKTKATGK